MNESLIQNIVYRWANRKGHQSIIPNIYVYSWESDMISITKAGYLHEYEIKITKSDFKADMKKQKKHQILEKGLTANRPNYFWYVCPDCIIKYEDIPAYAGVIYIGENYIRWNKRRKAPLLHKEKVREYILQKMINSFTAKYWLLRLEQQQRLPI